MVKKGIPLMQIEGMAYIDLMIKRYHIGGQQVKTILPKVEIAKVEIYN